MLSLKGSSVSASGISAVRGWSHRSMTTSPAFWTQFLQCANLFQSGSVLRIFPGTTRVGSSSASPHRLRSGSMAPFGLPDQEAPTLDLVDFLAFLRRLDCATCKICGHSIVSTERITWGALLKDTSHTCSWCACACALPNYCSCLLEWGPRETPTLSRVGASRGARFPQKFFTMAFARRKVTKAREAKTGRATIIIISNS